MNGSNQVLAYADNIILIDNDIETREINAVNIRKNM